MSESWIRFDMEKINQLKEDQEATKEAITEMLPTLNWDSQKQVRHHFLQKHDLLLQSVQISYLLSLLEKYPENSVIYDTIHGFTLYLKVKYALKNYTDCILRHHESGIVKLRKNDAGRLLMPNKQPIFFSPEVWLCVKSFSADVYQYIPEN